MAFEVSSNLKLWSQIAVRVTLGATFASSPSKSKPRYLRFATSFNLWWLGVKPTITHLCNWVVLLTTVTLDEVEVGPDFPVDLLPANSESFTDKSYELLKVPVPIDDMLGSHLTVSVN